MERSTQSQQQEKSSFGGAAGSWLQPRPFANGVAPENLWRQPDLLQPRPFANEVAAHGSGEVPQVQGKTEPMGTGFHFRNVSVGGATAPIPPAEPLLLQAKLTIGEPNDKYEQEADRVAKEVVQRIHVSGRAGNNLPTGKTDQSMGTVQPLQRVTEPEEEEVLQAKPLAILHRVPDASGEASAELEQSINRARGVGQSLSPTLQTQMGQAMGADFSNVRVHTDGQADRLSRSVSARAFTTGQDVFFKQGEYAPGSRSGQELIAHELTHVVQQKGEPIIGRQIIQREWEERTLTKEKGTLHQLEKENKVKTGRLQSTKSVKGSTIWVDTGKKIEQEGNTYFAAGIENGKVQGWIKEKYLGDVIAKTAKQTSQNTNDIPTQSNTHRDDHSLLPPTLSPERRKAWEVSPTETSTINGRISLGLSNIRSINPESGGKSKESLNKEDQVMSMEPMEDNVFIKYFTLMPGIKYSKVAQDFKANDHGNNFSNYDNLKKNTTEDYIKIKENFDNEFMRNQEEYTSCPDIHSSRDALEALDVMHPKTKNESTLIKALDAKNTELNQNIANKLNAEKKTTGDTQHPKLKDEGVTAKHAEAFSEMLKLRGSGDVLIRPAGAHAVKKLEADHPAKPLWIKGKSIDTTKLTLKQKEYLRKFLEKDQELQAIPKAPDSDDIITKLQEGFIPANQVYSKWLRDIGPDDIRKELSNTGKSLPEDIENAVEAILRLVEKTQKAIEEMKKTDLVGVDGSGCYISHPETKKAYTGDYDLYSISHRASEQGKAEELSELRKTRRGARKDSRESSQTYKESDIKDKGQDAYTPYAQQDVEKDVPDPAKVHKLFGNISRFEMGMKIDLNAAAFKWSDYKGGQVIKHGAEARNFQFPQKISDGMVTIKANGDNRFEDIKNEGDDIPETDYQGNPANRKDGEQLKKEPSHYVPRLLEQRNELSDKTRDLTLPLNQKLLNAETRRENAKKRVDEVVENNKPSSLLNAELDDLIKSGVIETSK